MLRWIERWRAKRRRNIFRFFDGSRHRCCDPIETLIKLQSHPRYDYTLHPKLVDDGDREAITVTCEAVQHAFDVKAYDATSNTGLTISEQLELLAEFCIYLEILKKNIGLPVILPSPTESTSNESSEPTSSGLSDSGPTAIAPKFDMPIVSEVQSAPP